MGMIGRFATRMRLSLLVRLWERLLRCYASRLRLVVVTGPTQSDYRLASHLEKSARTTIRIGRCTAYLSIFRAHVRTPHPHGEEAGNERRHPCLREIIAQDLQAGTMFS